MYNITEEQIKDIAQGGGKSKIKQMFPQVFQTVPEKGNWYRVKNLSDKFLIYFNGELGNKAGYGFDMRGGWSDSLGLRPSDRVERVADKEVEEALITEAKRRGFKEGTKFKSAMSGDERELNFSTLHYRAPSRIFAPALTNGNHIFYDGKWAEIIEEPKKLEVGKWYKSTSGAIAYYRGDLIETYGFNATRGWIETKHWFDDL